MKRIVLDPGHGGQDPGSVGNGLIEKRLTWEMSHRIKDKLSNHLAEVFIVQPSSYNPDSTNKEEVVIPPQKAKELRADYYLSVHINAGGGTGFESYVYPSMKGEVADKLRNIIHDQIMRFLVKHNIRDRGKKYANFYVIKKTSLDGIPSCLIELLFIDNSQDAALLKNETFLNGLANEIAYGLAVALKLGQK